MSAPGIFRYHGKCYRAEMISRTNNSIEFGYFPRPLDFTAGRIKVSTIQPDRKHHIDSLPDKRKKVETSGYAKAGWYSYIVPNTGTMMNGNELIDEWLDSAMPGESDYGIRLKKCLRKEELPSTHRLKHDCAEPRLKFLVRLLGFFYGMVFSAPLNSRYGIAMLRPYRLCDFYLDQRYYNDPQASLDPDKAKQSMLWAEYFLKRHHRSDAGTRLYSIMWRFFLSQKMTSRLITESFEHIYVGLDACYSLMQRLIGASMDRPSFPKKMDRLAAYSGRDTPPWAHQISEMRNQLLHESLIDPDEEKFRLLADVTFKMQRLVSRLIVPFLIGKDNAGQCDYVQSSIADREMYELRLPPPPKPRD